MIYKVLVVDDSHFFQNRLKDIINEHPKLTVIGVATNGQEAVDFARDLKPDVISMDYEMPLLDGVTAVKMILAERKVPIIMFSSLTFDGARITLDALDAGAVDFISKNFSEISNNSSSLKNKLHTRLLSFAQKFVASHQNAVNEKTKHEKPPFNSVAVLKSVTDNFDEIKKFPLKDNSHSPENNKGINNKGVNNEPASHLVRSNSGRVFRPRISTVLIIGASTGGPVAVNQVLECLPANFPLPIVVIQHMPPNFTHALAERLNRVCALSVAEAKNGDKLTAGQVLIAPGGMQCMFDSHGLIKLMAGDDRVNYKPSLDIAFASAANTFGDKVLGIVLTGMGADGCEGAKILKQKGGILWSQDEGSCVVFGMPKAVLDAGLSDHVLSPDQMGSALNRVS